VSIVTRVGISELQHVGRAPVLLRCLGFACKSGRRGRGPCLRDLQEEKSSYSEFYAQDNDDESHYFESA
jgi:hypothetical protein